MQRVAILGSTGSIGTQTLDVISQFPDRLQVVALAAGSNAIELRSQADRYGVKHLAVYDDRQQSGIPSGMQALIDLATLPEVDVVVVSVAGVIGLIPTIEAIRARKQIALASKEVLVAAGEIVMPLCKEFGIQLRPVDSEHSAIFQCLQGSRDRDVQELIITASGGPFRGKQVQDLVHVTVQQALNHPTWSMGGKITIDSATLMNKGLEAIEAQWLFDIPIDRVAVVVHPQSIVHSFVKFADGSVLGQMGWPNMRLPIAYALLYPDRVANDIKPWSPTDTPNLTFEPVDETTFECLTLARESARIGKTMPCAMNAANEEAANAFLRGEIKFLDIPRVVELGMRSHSVENVTLENLLSCDEQIRRFARELIEKGC